MTVITISQKIESRALFDRKLFISFPKVRLSFKKIAQTFLALIACVSIIGIFMSGIQSVQLIFSLRTLQQDLEKLKKENERLLLKVSDLARPDLLASSAAMLELKPVEKTSFITMEGPIVAGR